MKKIFIAMMILALILCSCQGTEGDNTPDTNGDTVVTPESSEPAETEPQRLPAPVETSSAFHDNASHITLIYNGNTIIDNEAGYLDAASTLDGGVFAYLWNGELCVATYDELKTIADGVADYALAVDSGDIAYIDDAGVLCHYSIKTGETTEIGNSGKFAISPNGNTVAYCTDNTVYCHTVDNGTKEVICEGGYSPLSVSDDLIIYADTAVEVGYYSKKIYYIDSKKTPVLITGEFKSSALCFNRDQTEVYIYNMISRGGAPLKNPLSEDGKPFGMRLNSAPVSGHTSLPVEDGTYNINSFYNKIYTLTDIMEATVDLYYVDGDGVSALVAENINDFFEDSAEENVYFKTSDDKYRKISLADGVVTDISAEEYSSAADLNG